MNESKNILKEGKSTEVLDLLSEPIINFDKNYEIIFVNTSFCNLIGFKKSEILGKNLFDLISKRNHFLPKIELGLQANSNNMSKVKINLNHKLGHEIPVEFNIPSMRSNNTSDLLAIIKVFTDLSTSISLYDKITDKFSFPILLLDVGFKIITFNYKFLSIIGYKEKEIRRKDLFSLDTELFEEEVKLIESYRDLLNKRKTKPILSKLKPKDSPSLWIKIESSLITLANKTYIQSVLQDFTEQKRLKRKIEEVIKFENELLRRTSHELKTPLISIKGFSNLLLELYSEDFTEEVSSIFKEINQGSQRLEDIVNSLLETTYLNSKKIIFSPSKEDLAFLIRYTVKDFKGLYMSRGIKVKLDIHEKMPIYLEKEKIYEVISNIFINAIKFSPPNTKIEVSSEISEDSYIISIRDQGIGLTEKEKSQIFKLFGKIERYGQGWDLNVGGMGMGLYISKKIIDLHKGKIWAESEGRGKGSVFYFSLPIRE